MGKRKRPLISCKEETDNAVLSIENELQVPQSKKTYTSDDLCNSADTPSPLSTFEECEFVASVDNGSKTGEIWPTAASISRPIQQLRTSIRVLNKQKKEEEKDSFLAHEAISKKIDGSSQDEEEEDTGNVEHSRDHEGKKRRRTWELWSMEDKDVFFEAINECGKDFDGIQNCLTTKMRKKGNPSYVVKNKDQVRHFYYRTWHKLSKYIKFSDDVKKSTQELYALINYGELRRKVGGILDEKKALKLQELIQKGSSSFRIKGKSIRVRTPICRALKRLNEFNDEREQMGIRVPNDLTVEIFPASLSSFHYVQSLAHNPRVKVHCSPDKPLIKLLEYLENKWRTTEIKYCEKLFSSSFAGKFPQQPSRILRLQPSSDADIKIIDVHPDANVKSSAVSLLSHEQMLRKKGENSASCFKNKPKKSIKHKKIAEKNDLTSETTNEEVDDGSEADLDEQIEQQTTPLAANADNDSDDEVTIISCLPPFSDKSVTEDRNPTPESNLSLLPVIKEEPEDEDNKAFTDQAIDPEIRVKEEGESLEVLHQLRALETVVNSPDADDDADVIYIGEKSRLSVQIQDKAEDMDNEEKHHSPQSKDELNSLSPTKKNLESLLSDIRKGWTTKTCGSISIGELYLMLGEKKHFSLEYSFEDEDNEGLVNNAIEYSEISKSQEQNKKDYAAISSPPSNKEFEVNEEKIKAKMEFSEMLLKLLNIVKALHTNAEPLESCICGYSGSVKNASNSLRSPATCRAPSNIGKSPGNNRSPRMCVGTRSPKVRSPNTLSKSPSTGKLPIIRPKPPSAKRLLPAISEELSNNAKNAEPSTSANSDIVSNNVAEIRKDIPIAPSSTQSEFRIPNAPAPKNIASQSFNAQLTKLRNLRPNRRSMLKNMVVQRQLPLLPANATYVPQSMMNLKVIPQTGNVENIGFFRPPIISDIAGSSLSTTTQLSSVGSQLLPASSRPIFVQPVSVASTSDVTCNNNANLANALPSNAISVNVSGHQLLTVEMPTFSSSNTSSVKTESLPLRPDLVTQSSPNITNVKTVTTTSESSLSVDKVQLVNTCALPVSSVSSFHISENSTISVNDLLSQAFADGTDLTTPPCTPIPENINPLLDNSLLLTREVLTSVSDVNSIIQCGLSPPCNISDTSLSILNTPKHVVSSTGYEPVTPIKLNFSALLSTVSPIKDGPPVSSMSTAGTNCSVASSSIPEIHIPDPDHLPLLDVSFSSLSVETPSSISSSNSTLMTSEVLTGCLSSSISDLKKNDLVPDKISKESISLGRIDHPLNEPHCDKLMDVTLGNSNSNSTFSALLAAVVQPTLDHPMESTLQTPPRPSTSQVSPNSKSDAKNNLNFSTGFANLLPSLPASPPSPSRFLHQSENTWLQNEVNDFSLSSLLGNIDSSNKVMLQPLSSNSSGVNTTALPVLQSNLSKDGSLPVSNSVVSDNSLDFSSVFAKLKGQTSLQELL